MIGRWTSLGLKLALTGGLLWFLFRRIDVAEVWQVARGLKAEAILWAILLIAVQQIICAFRWQIVLRLVGAPLGFVRAQSIVLVSTFLGLVLPGAVGGDAVRVWLVVRTGMGLSPAFHSVMLERVATLFALVLTVTLLEPKLAANLPDSRGLWLFPALTLGLVAGTACVMLLDQHAPGLARWKLVRAAARFAADTRRVFLAPLGTPGLIAIAIIGHLNLALLAYALAWGLGIQISLINCVVLYLPAVLVATLPISVAGWGAREAAIVALFGMVGVPAAQALTLSVLIGLFSIVGALPGGPLWLMTRDRAGLLPASGVEA